MEWSTGDLVWFDHGLGHPLPGEIQEVHRAAQVIVVQALINGKVNNASYIKISHIQSKHYAYFNGRTLIYSVFIISKRAIFNEIISEANKFSFKKK